MGILQLDDCNADIPACGSSTKLPCLRKQGQSLCLTQPANAAHCEPCHKDIPAHKPFRKSVCIAVTFSDHSRRRSPTSTNFSNKHFGPMAFSRFTVVRAGRAALFQKVAQMPEHIYTAAVQMHAAYNHRVAKSNLCNKSRHAHDTPRRD